MDQTFCWQRKKLNRLSISEKKSKKPHFDSMDHCNYPAKNHLKPFIRIKFRNCRLASFVLFSLLAYFWRSFVNLEKKLLNKKKIERSKKVCDSHVPNLEQFILPATDSYQYDFESSQHTLTHPHIQIYIFFYDFCFFVSVQVEFFSEHRESIKKIDLIRYFKLKNYNNNNNNEIAIMKSNREAQNETFHTDHIIIITTIMSAMMAITYLHHQHRSTKLFGRLVLEIFRSNFTKSKQLRKNC